MVMVVAEAQAPERVSVLIGDIVKCINSQQYVASCASSASGVICQVSLNQCTVRRCPHWRQCGLTRLHNQKHALRGPSYVSESLAVR